jgi:predicted RNA-binding Zn ribbon-like protein
MAAVPAGSRPSTPVPPELRFDAGRLCLDLVATAHPDERLGSPDRLRAWLAGAGLVPEGAALPSCAPAWLPAFRELRGRVGQLVRGELAGQPVPAALERVNALARAAPPAPCAVRAGDGSLVRSLQAEPGCAALLAVVARDAVDLLTDPAARGALRQCAGDNCPLIYLDTSRGRRRRWCSSEVCGNRERVARHRRRAAALARA